MGIDSQLSEILSHLKSVSAYHNPSVSCQARVAENRTGTLVSNPEPDTEAAGIDTEAFQVGNLQLFLLPNSPEAVSETLSVRRACAATGKLNKFTNLSTVSPFPSQRLSPESEGLFGRIKSAYLRDFLEAEVLWNIRNNCQNALATAHKVTEALVSKNVQAATEAFSVPHHFSEASYSRVLERIDFLTDAL